MRLRKVRFHYWIFLGLFSGLIFGLFTNFIRSHYSDVSLLFQSSEIVLMVSEFVGSIFIKLLKMIIVPLIFSSIVVGLNSIERGDNFARMGLKTIFYYLSTSIISIFIGLFLVNMIKPGFVEGKPNPVLVKFLEENKSNFIEKGLESKEYAEMDSVQVTPLSFIFNLINKMVPSNVFKSASDNSAMLSLIFVSLLVAFAIMATKRINPKEVDGILVFFRGLNAIMIKITDWIMMLLPFCVFAFMVKAVGHTGFDIIKNLLMYFFTVVLALLIHLLIILPLILKLVARVNPLDHFKAMKEALLMAFSSSSSAATLPITLRCIQDNVGVSKRTSSFVLPLGATVNMDGTALYECVAVLFITQVLGHSLDLGQQFMVVILALLTSIGVAGVPSASLVAIVLIINNLGLFNNNSDAAATVVIGAIFTVDRLLDMTRTAVNVFSDSCGALVIAKSEKEKNILF